MFSTSCNFGIAGAVLISALAPPSFAQNGVTNAAESDPRVLGWMQGTPIPEDKRISLQAGDFFNFPKTRWTVCHIRALFPTVNVSRGLGPIIPLEYAPHHEFANMRSEIDAVTFTPMGSDEEMTWAESLGVDYTDGKAFPAAGFSTLEGGSYRSMFWAFHNDNET